MSESPILVLAGVAAFGLLVVTVVLLAMVLSRLRVLAAAAVAATRDAAELRTRIEVVAGKSDDFERDLKQDLALARAEQANVAKLARQEFAAAAQATRQELAATLTAQGQAIHRQSATQALATSGQLEAVRTAVDQQLESLRGSVESRLDQLRSDNAAKLEQMRATVDEKLQTTLEQRLGQSFKQVSDRLDQVHQGLGEMQALATGVGDLKRVLTNVKSRGGWGEVQLGALLAEMLTPAQYEENVATRPGSRERVEFAIRFPGRGDDGAPCWLPIDAKFPLEDYQRLQDAIERADSVGVEAARKSLDAFFRAQARSIRDKYVEPPHTTDFAILFVPTEGLYAEAVSRPGLADALQRDFRVMLAGPTNLAALLNSLQLGFRTLAIEQRSTEVWRVLAAVKTEFGKFGEILARTKDRLDQVGRTLDEAGRKSTTIARKLRDVEALPQAEADRLLTGDAVALSTGDSEPLPDRSLDHVAPPA